MVEVFQTPISDTNENLNLTLSSMFKKPQSITTCLVIKFTCLFPSPLHHFIPHTSRFFISDCGKVFVHVVESLVGWLVNSETLFLPSHNEQQRIINFILIRIEQNQPRENMRLTIITCNLKILWRQNNKLGKFMVDNVYFLVSIVFNQISFENHETRLNVRLPTTNFQSSAILEACKKISQKTFLIQLTSRK